MSMCCARFGLRQHILDGCRSFLATKLLDLESLHDLGGRDEADDWDASCFNRLASTLFSVDQRQYAHDDSVRGADGFNGTKRRSSSRDYVLDDSDTITCLERSFDGFPGSVSLCLFAYGKGSHGAIGISAGIADSVGNRVSPKGEPADWPMIDRPSGLIVVNLAST